MRYAIVIEKAEGNYSAYVPDLPGCVATGATVAEVEGGIREAIAFHVEGLREDGLPIPAPSKGIEMSQIQPRNAFASYRRVDLTESIHTRKEIFHSGHPTDIQHH